jgi:hypothetical protein
MSRLLQLSMGILIAVSLTGCDQIRDKVGSLFQDKTPQQVAQEAQQALAVGQPQKAIDLTKPYLEKPGQADPQLLITAAHAYAVLGDVPHMLSALDILVLNHGLDKTQLMNDGAFTAVRSDIRFVSWVANVSGRSMSSAPDVSSQAAPGVSAEIGPSGVSARAGNVSVRIGN